MSTFRLIAGMVLAGVCIGAGTFATALPQVAIAVDAAETTEEIPVTPSSTKSTWRRSVAPQRRLPRLASRAPVVRWRRRLRHWFVPTQRRLMLPLWRGPPALHL